MNTNIPPPFVDLLRKWQDTGAVGCTLTDHRKKIGGHESSGLFRRGGKGVGVVLLQVKTDWNPKFLNEGKLFVSNTPARMKTVRDLKPGMALPCVAKGSNKGEEWAWCNWWKLNNVVFKSKDAEAIIKECGVRGKNKTGNNFDVGAVVTFIAIPSPLKTIGGVGSETRHRLSNSSAASSPNVVQTSCIRSLVDDSSALNKRKAITSPLASSSSLSSSSSSSSSTSSSSSSSVLAVGTAVQAAKWGRTIYGGTIEKIFANGDYDISFSKDNSIAKCKHCDVHAAVVQGPQTPSSSSLSSSSLSVGSKRSRSSSSSSSSSSTAPVAVAVAKRPKNNQRNMMYEAEIDRLKEELRKSAVAAVAAAEMQAKMQAKINKLQNI